MKFLWSKTVIAFLIFSLVGPAYGLPVKTIQRSDVYIRVTGVMGTVEITGWTNGDQHKAFWSNIRYSSKPPTISLPDYAWQYWDNFARAGNASEFFGDNYANKGGIARFTMTI